MGRATDDRGRPGGAPPAAGPLAGPATRSGAGARPPGRRLARLMAPLGALAPVAAAFAYVAAVDPNEPGHYPVCPLLRLTGLSCPGCGGLRSAHALAHGDLVAALDANALAVLLLALGAVAWAGWCVRVVRGARHTVTRRTRTALWWALGALTVLFTVVRNLPFAEALAVRATAGL
ncbi:DUF2752 domain-containing protein [Streptomyces sp. URMC 123]|uniref:DUF2752 domain-containing protein n=1 Tax=Streptomyces sp. URMC 123 TaxID=3423403 RepID=UPI003F1C39AA